MVLLFFLSWGTPQGVTSQRFSPFFCIPISRQQGRPGCSSVWYLWLLVVQVLCLYTILWAGFLVMDFDHSLFKDLKLYLLLKWLEGSTMVEKVYS